MMCHDREEKALQADLECGECLLVVHPYTTIDLATSCLQVDLSMASLPREKGGILLRKRRHLAPKRRQLLTHSHQLSFFPGTRQFTSFSPRQTYAMICRYPYTSLKVDV